MKTRNKLLLLLTLLALNLSVLAQVKKTVTGTVKDAAGTPLSGATIAEKGTSNKSLSNPDGTFTIKVNPNATLEITYVGYEKKDIAVTGDNIIAVLEISTKGNLDEVVVTALGIQKQKKSLGYATTVIKSAELVKTAPTNIASALYGKAPGVRIATAPGGSLGGVAIQIRGLNSITGRTQPLIIMDGIPIRDGDFNNGNYWGDQRLRGNGLLDINPEDIENINVLKGASAAALYGSEAKNGVLVITTKSGKNKKGFSVDFSTTYFQDRVAYLPRFQKVRGAGSPVQYDVYGQDADGFNSNKFTVNGQSYRALVQGSLNFGPKFDGQPIATWDGQVRPYSPIKNGWANLFQHANNTVNNLAFAFTGDNSSTRFSLTHQHYEGVSLNSANDKFNINLNSMFNFGKKVKLNVVINDVFSKVKNRPFLIDRLVNNFAGMMPTFDDGAWYRNKFQTSQGYKYVTGSNPNTFTPDENIRIPNYRTDILDFMWNVMKNQQRESNNRLIASTTLFYDITPHLQFRGKLATDWTSNLSEDMQYSSVPTVYGYSGYYGIGTTNYSILYGDLLLTYNRQINKDFDLKVMGGYTGDRQQGYTTSIGTNGGLTTVNRFDLTSSALSNYNSGSDRTRLVKDAVLGTVNVGYRNYLFLEGTVRRDRTSTMNPNNNAFVYPSLNGAFVISDAMKLPSLFTYAKLRGSWGIVGSYPSPYQANVTYDLRNLGNQGSGSVLATMVPTGDYGNDNIKPEQKKEFEIGLETRLLGDHLNIDVAYYNAKIVDMLIPLQIAPTTGANSILSNVGNLRNTGVDISINATPYRTKDFKWETGLNLNFNNNKILKLADGSNELIHADYDGNAAVLKSVVGRPIGDFYAHPILTDSKGQKVIADYGGGEFNYQIDGSKLERYGNAQIKAVGGFFNSFKYKGLTLDLYTDFRIGGHVMPTALFWMTSRGLTEESLNYMDAAHGGVSYYKDAQGRGVETSAAAGPNGEKVYHDGVKMGGVFPDGTPNTYVTSQFFYYWDQYNWGGPQYSNSQYFRYIVKNTYWKMREISLSYTLPSAISQKLKATKLQVAVFGRNLFYLYRTIKDMDAEQLTAGLSWNASLTNAGSQPSTRSFGVSVRASF